MKMDNRWTKVRVLVVLTHWGWVMHIYVIKLTMDCDITDYCHVAQWLLSQKILKITYNDTWDNRLLFRLLHQNHWLLKFLRTTPSTYGNTHCSHNILTPTQHCILLHFFILTFRALDRNHISSSPGYSHLNCHQTSNVSCTLGNKIVDHSDVVGASPVGTVPTTSSFLI